MEAVRQKTIPTCINPQTQRLLPLDICLESKRLIIEIDGMHHFRDNKYWGSNAINNITRDVYKMQKCLEAGYSVYRIVQEDVWGDTYDWRNRLSNIIDEAPYTDPIVIFEDRDGIYKRHKDLLLNVTGDLASDDDSE